MRLGPPDVDGNLILITQISLEVRMVEDTQRRNSGRLDRTMTLKDGRKLGFAEYGDPEGKVVFHFNGSGGSRLEHPPNEAILTELGVRYISTDRPGLGLSDPQPDRRLLDWPDGIAQLADHLGIDRFHVLGWSAGGPHALACAYKLPHRVEAGAIVSGLAPPDRPHYYQGLSLQNRILMFVLFRFPFLARLFSRMMYAMVMGDSEVIGSKLALGFPPEDRLLLKISANRKMLVDDIREGFRQGWRGPARDAIVISSPWGFRLEDIPVRIDVWQGEVDRNVPLNQGLYQHEHLQNSNLRVVPGQAHLYLLTKWREVLEALVA